MGMTDVLAGCVVRSRVIRLPRSVTRAGLIRFSAFLFNRNIFSALHDLYRLQKEKAKLRETDPDPNVRRAATLTLAVMRDPTAGMTSRLFACELI